MFFKGKMAENSSLFLLFSSKILPLASCLVVDREKDEVFMLPIYAPECYFFYSVSSLSECFLST